MNPAIASPPYRGWLDPRIELTPSELIAQLPSGTVAHQGRRSRIVRISIKGSSGLLDLAVKCFAPRSFFRSLSDRCWGSKAFRTWAIATHLSCHGAGTPRPFGYLERWQGLRLAESYYLSEWVPGLTSFRNELIRLYREDPECAKVMRLLEVVADGIRKMHEAGVVHRDLGNQNILLRRVAEADWADVQFVDLNRAIIRKRLSMKDRARDISRIALPSDFLRVFIEMYFQDVPPRSFLRWERFYRGWFDLHTASRRWRHPIRERAERRRPASPAVTYPPERDLWIWDERSGQAISTMTTRDRRKHQPIGNLARSFAAVARRGSAVWRHYRRLLPTLYAQPRDLSGAFGLAVHPDPTTTDRELALLEGLGRIPVLIRFYVHKGPEHWAFMSELGRRLHEAGHAVAVALIQDRKAVLDPARWRNFVASVLNCVAEFADWVEVGHAVNRVKWGIWDYREYRGLIAAVAELAGRYPRLRFMGPAGIDFEYPAVLAFLEQVPSSFRFQALSHHLYVDRRGAPENPQAGFTLEKKCALARAMAAASPACEERLIISEVNWPLLGTGVYSPVGSPYVSPGPRFNDPSVSEETYADYMVRYLLIAACSGMVERVYWWRLVARGYGLVDDTDPHRWRPRPAYEQFRTLLRLLGTARFVRKLPAPDDERRFEFQTPEGETVIAAWCLSGTRHAKWAESCTTALDARGHETKDLAIGGSPRYFLFKQAPDIR